MKSVTVVGSGIVGLTSAIVLQENGSTVTIVAKEHYSKTLSSKVGAIWFPFEIEPAKKANKWAALSYQRYQEEAKNGNDVSFIPFLTAYTSESNTKWTEQLPAGAVRNATPEELPKGIEKAFVSNVPLMEPLKYLPFLFNRFIENGGHFEKSGIASLKEMSSLNSLVVNCTGLGAKELCNDNELIPMRGQILRCAKLNTPSFAEPTKKGALTYVINRSGDSIIGGTDYENNWNVNIEKSDTDLILSRFESLGLDNKTPQILEEMVGLRPKRKSVRFEFDQSFNNIFHNYGHGGAGFTVAWGCAIELSEILSKT
ncbi:FAD-dependent oxidoreductase [Fulvivirga lutimaris]|uniref:FAD-dependent oxidoreductase n=1 Tax=Fulvivirga lutimaris TaxID=1819566 RepID=UPI0012BC966F|nr:FAD-dependent oxidoreductase [Fulvivirga lutimaris]MTI41550.1 FAD-binding oxidoreductase [Fulvivirga lutimaris]